MLIGNNKTKQSIIYNINNGWWRGFFAGAFLIFGFYAKYGLFCIMAWLVLVCYDNHRMNNLSFITISQPRQSNKRGGGFTRGAVKQRGGMFRGLRKLP